MLMQFLIHGADQKTGKEMTIVVDARDQTEAEQRVLYNDILIASMAQFAPPPIISDPNLRPPSARNKPARRSTRKFCAAPNGWADWRSSSGWSASFCCC